MKKGLFVVMDFSFYFIYFCTIDKLKLKYQDSPDCLYHLSIQVWKNSSFCLPFEYLTYHF